MRILAVIAAVISLGAPALAGNSGHGTSHDGADAPGAPNFSLQCGAVAGCTNR